MVKKCTDTPLNAIPRVPGQAVTLKGVPSSAAMDRMAEVPGDACDWADRDSLPPDRRDTLRDDVRDGGMRRRTCILRPRQGQTGA